MNDVSTNLKTPTNTFTFGFSFGDSVQLFGDEYFVVNFERDDFISSSNGASLYDSEYKVLMYGKEISGMGAATGFGMIILFAYILLAIIWVVIGLKGFPIAGLWHLTVAL